MTNTNTTPYGPMVALLEERSMTTSKVDLEAMGVALATAIGRPSPYSYQHLHGIARGYLWPGKALQRAIDALLAAEDGADPLLAASVETKLMIPREISDDARFAYCPIPPKFCSDPHDRGCTNRFIPNVSWREACYTCSPIRRKD